MSLSFAKSCDMEAIELSFSSNSFASLPLNVMGLVPEYQRRAISLP